MTDSAADFYDQFAGHFHLIFENWEASMTRQAVILGSILEHECGRPDCTTVLDCACGIGAQALGPAKRGFVVTGSDVSRRTVERARQKRPIEALRCQSMSLTC